MENEVTNVIGIIGFISLFFEIYFIHAHNELKNLYKRNKEWQKVCDSNIEGVHKKIKDIENDIRNIKKDIECLKE